MYSTPLARMLKEFFDLWALNRLSRHSWYKVVGIQQFVMTPVGHGIMTQVSQGIMCVFKCCRTSCPSGYRLMRKWLSECSSTMLKIMKIVAVRTKWWRFWWACQTSIGSGSVGNHEWWIRCRVELSVGWLGVAVVNISTGVPCFSTSVNGSTKLVSKAIGFCLCVALEYSSSKEYHERGTEVMSRWWYACKSVVLRCLGKLSYVPI